MIVVASFQGLASVVVWLRKKFSVAHMSRVAGPSVGFVGLAFFARGDVIKRSCLPGPPEDLA